IVRSGRQQDADAPHALALLRAGRERPRCRAAKQRYELAAFQSAKLHLAPNEPRPSRAEATAHYVPPLRRLRLHPVSGPRKRPPADHSALILAPENSTTLLHFSTSLATNLLKSAGEPGSGVPPSSAIRAFVLGSAKAALSSLLSLSTISTGVSLGAPTPYQALAS